MIEAPFQNYIFLQRIDEHILITSSCQVRSSHWSIDKLVAVAKLDVCILSSYNIRHSVKYSPINYSLFPKNHSPTSEESFSHVKLFSFNDIAGHHIRPSMMTNLYISYTWQLIRLQLSSFSHKNTFTSCHKLIRSTTSKDDINLRPFWTAKVVKTS